MRLRLTTIDEFQFLTCLQHELWGAKKSRFKSWEVGDLLAFKVDKSIAALAQMSGESLYSKKRVWDNGVFPYRVPLKFLYAFLPENRPPVLGPIRDILTSEWGPKYGWGILNQLPLEGKSAETIVEVIRSRHNDLAEIRATLEQHLADAKLKREAKTKGGPKKVKAPEKQPEPVVDEEPVASKKEESAHSRAQSALIQLGNITRCSVWIASNDRNRVYRGRKLGEGCLEELPNLGLSQEATRRISLIDTIWLRQNAPVCAFEVETTTSIYSGLLRMSDLLALVPALNINLFIVAPSVRQTRVMAELSRPTFQKIGLSEFCRFIAAEDLGELLEKVKDFPGYIDPMIIESKAIALEDESAAME